MLRPLLASQHETRVQFGILTNNAVQIQKLGKDVSCFQGKHYSTMIELVKSACNRDSASALHKSQSETLDLLEQNVYIV